MKKSFTLLIAIFFTFIAKAQYIAPDFTATDIHGNEIHLYEILEGGQYVFIDFFFANCGPCQDAAPNVKEAYELVGCNDFEVFFMEISPMDNNSQLNNWCNNYGIEYPTIGTDGNGSSICDTYGINAFPTFVLIAPNKEIVIQDISSEITSPWTIIGRLAAHGIKLHDCIEYIDTPTNVNLSVEDGEELGTKIANISWEQPNPSYNILFNIYRNNEQIATNIKAKEFTDLSLTEYIYNESSTNIELEYCVEAVKGDIISNKECILEEINLCIAPYDLVSSIDKEGITGFEWKYIYYANLAEKLLILRDDEIIDSLEIKDLSDGIDYEYFDESEDLEYNKEYKYNVVAVYSDGCKATSESIFLTPALGIDKLKNEITIYPNPARDFINIYSENIKFVKIYDMFGRIIDTINNIETNLVSINTANYNKGTYFLKITLTNNKTVIKKVIIY